MLQHSNDYYTALQLNLTLFCSSHNHALVLSLHILCSTKTDVISTDIYFVRHKSNLQHSAAVTKLMLLLLLITKI